MRCGVDFAGELGWADDGPVERGRSGTEAGAVGVILIRFPSGCCEVCVVAGELSFEAPSNWFSDDSDGDGDCAREGFDDAGGELGELLAEGPGDAAGF
jgi:hypothetical protein